MTVYTLSTPSNLEDAGSKKALSRFVRGAWTLAGKTADRMAFILPEPLVSAFWLVQPAVRDTFVKDSHAVQGFEGMLKAAGPGY